MPQVSVNENFYAIDFPPVVELRTLQDKNASVAEVSYYTLRTGFVKATGSSKREPGDRYNPAIGEKLAVARAMQKLGRELARLANAEVKAVTPNDR